MVQRLELMKGSSEPLLLCLIGQQPMYGYQILKELDNRSQGYFKFKEGTLYPALHRLETVGLIIGEWQMLPSGRQRRYYNITEKGRQLLVVKRGQWQDFLIAMNMIIQPVSV
ncbi:PadR family transcriptional regulator [Chloroflexota bacterium]